LQQFVSESILETKKIAAGIAKNTAKGCVLALIGDLGTGKTAFAQGFAAAMGISESVGSPTYKFISEYQGINGWLYHIDCYRLENEQQFINIGGEEYLASTNGITLIEWADIVMNILPENILQIRFERIINQQNHRKIIINENNCN